MSKNGLAQWSVSYPKYKDGGTIMEIKVKCTYNYIEKLNSVVQNLRFEYPSYDKAKDFMTLFHTNIPPLLTVDIEKSSKDDLKEMFRTRFILHKNH